MTNLLQNSRKLHIHESGVAYSTYIWNQETKYHDQTVPINQETNKAKGAFVKVSLVLVLQEVSETHASQVSR